MSAQDEIYHGFWTNHAVGGIYASTLTLSSRNGSYLIAFLALFIRIVGSAAWSIVRLLLFRCYSTAIPMDGLHHQRQAVLRNTTTEVSTTTMLYNLWSGWRGKSHRGPWKTASILLASSLNLGFFAAAGVLASRVKYSATEVLVKANPGDCGIMESFYNRLSTDKDEDYLRYWTAHDRIDSHASSLSRHCYNGTSALDASSCGVPGRQVIPWTMSTAICPFDDSICGDVPSVRFDSGLIDSLLHLGINSAPHDRILTRIQATCQPLDVTKRLAFLDDIDDHRVNSTPFVNASSTTVAWGRSVALYLGSSMILPREETYVSFIPKDGDSPAMATQRGFSALTSPIGLQIEWVASAHFT